MLLLLRVAAAAAACSAWKEANASACFRGL